MFRVIEEYEEKIAQVTRRYEERLKCLEKETSKCNETYSTTARESYSREVNEFESLLLARDNEISLLKIENSKLRRENSRLQASFGSKLKLIAELEYKIER